jgi:TIR domain
MPHDVFISHSTAGKLTASAICSELESAGIRCWILPRDLDVESGLDQSIANAVACCRIMVVVLSDYAGRSDRVERQLELAFDKGMVVIPFRTKATSVVCEPQPIPRMLHWLDAMTPEMAQRLRSLRDTVRVLNGDAKDQPSHVRTSEIEKEEAAHLKLDNIGAFALREAAKVPLPLPATELVEESSSSAAGTISSPDLERIEETESEPEGAAPHQPVANSKRFPMKLLLMLPPFAIICGVGVWKAYEWYRPQRQPPSPATATATPSIVPPGPAIVERQHRIPAEDPGWGTPDANWTVANGKLRITPLLNSSAVLINRGRGFTDAEITGEIMMLKGENLDQLGGLIFWAKDYNDFYAFVISADGKFAIGRKLIGRWINPVAKTGTLAIKAGTGQTNKLRVRTEGHHLTASINNNQVATLEAEAPQGFSYIGLYGESAGTAQNVWEFTNVTVHGAIHTPETGH